jgi:hypothetical protein
VTTGRKWLAGCGVGCGLLLLAGVGACVIGSLYLRHTFRGIEKAARSHEALVAELGDLDEYVPPADGAPDAERLETFVKVRQATAESRARVEAVVARLPPSELSGDGAVIGKIRLGLDVLGNLIDAMGTYIQARNRVLMEEEMGVGEYVYLYTLTYCSWLGHSPVEAPIAREDSEGTRVGAFDDRDALFGERAVRRRYRRYVLGLARRQLARAGREVGEGEVWRERIEGEIRRLELDPGHVLWQDGLPEAIESSLRPFRAPLEATWSESTNRIELPLAEHETPWEWS